MYGCALYAMPGAQGGQKRELDITGTGVMEGLSHYLSARTQALVPSKSKCSYLMNHFPSSSLWHFIHTLFFMPPPSLSAHPSAHFLLVLFATMFNLSSLFLSCVFYC